MGCLAGCFARVEPRRQACKYVAGLISDLPRKNCWALAEQAGDATPDKMQRLLERAAWDASDAMREIRTFVVSRLGDPAGAVLVLDESGQEKAGEHTAGVKRQYLGFATKPQLGTAIVRELITEGRCPPWVTGDEVYGRDAKLRTFLEDQGTGYVLKIPWSFRVTLPAGQKVRADHAARLVPASAWQTASAGHGSKGERDYGRAWVATASARHHLLIRRNLRDHSDLACVLCHVPAGRACSFTTLVRVAGRRWPAEEDFALGKSWFGLADSQVRRYTAITRHLALAMAALAVCTVTAALARPRTTALARPPTSPGDPPPGDPGLVPLTAAEIKRVFNLVTRAWQTIGHYLRWSWWRRRHQARARWFHQRSRLRRRAADP